MKYVSLLSLFALISCGEVHVDGGTGVGELKSISPVVVESSQVQTLTTVCQAIARKSNAANALINTPVLFSYARKGCADEKLSTPADVPTTIQSVYARFKFLKEDGSQFYFSDIETTNAGSLAEICSQLNVPGGIQSPIQNSNEYLYFSTTGVNNDDCPAIPNQQCVVLMRGSGNGQGLAQIHTKEWVRINLETLQGREGFFTWKKDITTAGCATGETIINTALAK